MPLLGDVCRSYLVDSATDGDSLRLQLDVHCSLTVKYFDRIRSRVNGNATLSTTSTTPYDENSSSRFDSFLNGDIFRQIRCISPAIFEMPLAQQTLCWKTAKLLAMNVATCCRSPWLWASCTANGGATKRNPDKHNLLIALE